MSLHENTKSPFVKKKSIEILPQMYKYISNHDHFSERHLHRAIMAIFNFLQPPVKKGSDKDMGKDRGQGFIALGKMSLLVPKK
jgi:hypothetical protein